MKTPGFNYHRSPGATRASGLRTIRARDGFNWLKIDNQVLAESTDSGTTRIFAIAIPPPVSSGGKTIRRILIFDNHPESLRLLCRRRPRPDVDLVAARRAGPAHLMFGLLLMLALSIGMFWPLFVR